MSFICKGVCTRYKAKKPKEGRYASGQKRSNFCNVFFNWDGLWCPCCGMTVRTRSRNGGSKRKILHKKLKLRKYQTNDNSICSH